MRRLGLLTLLLTAIAHAATRPDALVVAVADQHSAYDRLPAVIGVVDRLRADNPNVPLAILIDGDTFEYGNRVARRTNGQLEFEALRELARRAPTVLNIGNHETDLFSMSDLVDRVRGAGVTVISGNARSRESGKPFAAPSVRLQLGGHTIAVVGFTTDALATYRFAVRPTLDLDNPVNWTRAHLSEELGRAEVPIVLSHAGLRADREILPLVPRGTLFIGGHDHIRLVHATDTATYVHTGSWLQSVTVAELRFREGTPQWTVDQTNLTDVQPQDAAFTAMVRTTITAALTADDQRIVGRTREAMTAAAAARFAVESARRAANADLAIVGATTFGDGLPRGDVTAYAFDNCVRFDGPLYVATLSGKAARALLRRCNQDPNTPFDERTGENLIASARGDLDDASTYRIVTTDWIGRNPAALLGKDAPKFTEVPELTLKRSVTDALK